MSDAIVPQSALPIDVVVPPKRPRGRPRKVKVEEGAAPVVPAQKPAVHTVVHTAVRAAKKPAVKAEAVAVAPTRMVTPLQYVFAVGRRKRATAKVFLHTTGKGEIEINGRTLVEFFPIATVQQMILAPLENSSFRQSVRIVVKVLGGGFHGQAGAVRHGITRALVKLDESLRPLFRARGYLTRDSREKERKKPGLKKARRGPQWAKR